MRLGGFLADAPGGGHGSLQGGFPVMPVRLPVEVTRQDPGELPGAGIEAVVCGEGNGGELDLMLASN